MQLYVDLYMYTMYSREHIIVPSGTIPGQLVHPRYIIMGMVQLSHVHLIGLQIRQHLHIIIISKLIQIRQHLHNYNYYKEQPCI